MVPEPRILNQTEKKKRQKIYIKAFNLLDTFLPIFVQAIKQNFLI